MGVLRAGLPIVVKLCEEQSQRGLDAEGGEG